MLYEIDKVDLFMLLDARENLFQTSEQFNADSVQYALSTVDVAYQSGRLLDDLGISIVGSEIEHDSSKVEQTLRESLPTPAAQPPQEIETLESSQPSSPLPDVQPLPEPRTDESTFVIPPAKVTAPPSLRLPKPGSGDTSLLPARMPSYVTEKTALAIGHRAAQDLSEPQSSLSMIEADGNHHRIHRPLGLLMPMG